MSSGTTESGYVADVDSNYVMLQQKQDDYCEILDSACQQSDGQHRFGQRDNARFKIQQKSRYRSIYTDLIYLDFWIQIQIEIQIFFLKILHVGLLPSFLQLWQLEAV